MDTPTPNTPCSLTILFDQDEDGNWAAHLAEHPNYCTSAPDGSKLGALEWAGHLLVDLAEWAKNGEIPDLSYSPQAPAPSDRITFLPNDTEWHFVPLNGESSDDEL